MKEITFEITEDSVKLKNDNVKLSDLVYIISTSLNAIKNYSESDLNIDYESIIKGIIASQNDIAE